MTTIESIVKEFEENVKNGGNESVASCLLRAALEKVRNEVRECQTCHGEGSTCTHPATVKEKEAYERGKFDEGESRTEIWNRIIPKTIQATRAEDVAVVEEKRDKYKKAKESLDSEGDNRGSVIMQASVFAADEILSALKSLNEK